MDDFERAQTNEQQDRELTLRKHANRARPSAVAVKRPDGSVDYHCAECDEDLPAHRVEYGLCIDCATAAEIRGKQFARN